MIFRSAVKSEHAIPHWKSPPKPITPIYLTQHDSARKSTSSTYLSSRSNSAKKILISKSPQLNQFFNEPRYRSTQKRLASPLS